MPATFRGRPDATGNFVVPQRWLSRGSTEVLGKLPDRANVLVLRLLAKLAHPHVLDHALA
jgi:hypothetical protein